MPSINTDKVLTVPNLLSAFRILLIPVFIFYFYPKSIENHYICAAAVFIISGVSDVVDGIVARSFNMVSNLGKVLDPIADKLTQASVLICLASIQKLIIPLVVLLFAKEILMLIGAIIMVRRGTRPSAARWWGKMSTVILFVSMILFLLTSLYDFLPDAAIIALVAISGVSILFSLFNYYPVFRDILADAKKADS